MAERTYTDADWAVQRWDRFNARAGDHAVLPLSFCHFWRTVILHETLQQMFTPWRVVDRLARRFKRFTPLGVALMVVLLAGGGGTLSGASLLGSFVVGVILGTALGFLWVFQPELQGAFVARLGTIHLSFWRGVGHVLWLLVWPLRKFFPPAGRRGVSIVVAVGEPFDRYVKRHKVGLDTLVTWALLAVVAGMVGFVVVALLLESWLVTLAGIGVLVVVLGLFILGVPQAFWRFFIAVMGLLWGAAVAAKHGVCPPVTIVRRDARSH